MLGTVCAGQTPSESGVEGVIKIGPTQPGPIKADSPAFMPLANTAFVAKGDDGGVTEFETDSEGRFRVVLKPGHYTISVKGQRPAIGHFGPFSADVIAGKMTTVDLQCDSGIR